MEGDPLDTIHQGGANPERIEFLMDQNERVLYWGGSASGNLHRYDIVLQEKTTLFEEYDFTDNALAYDPINKEIFWSVRFFGDTWSASVEMGSPSLIMDKKVHYIRDLEIDHLNQLVYWIGGSDIDRRILYTGYEFDLIDTLFVEQSINPGEIEIDFISSKIYWVDYDSNEIFRKSLSGEGLELWGGGVDRNRSELKIDSENNKILWSEFDSLSGYSIMISNLDAYEPVVLYASPDLEVGFELDVDMGEVVFLEYEMSSTALKRIDYNGFNMSVIPQDEPFSQRYAHVSLVD
ncbi:MAG: hypothetical protein AAFO91_00575, partial [Bacteroidota bacterium]